MALVRVYCGLASAEPTGRPAGAGTGLTAAVVDDAGRLLGVCEITDDPAGYAQLGAVLAERANGPGSAAIAADSDDHQVTSLLTAAGRPLAIADDDAVDDFAERFADDESLEEMESPPAERRAVGLARALQAGAIFAIGLPVPRDLAPYRPILAAHSALAGGRHSAAATLREVLRELYPAALRAFSDPAEPLALAVLDALPEPGMLSGTVARGRDLPPGAEAVAVRLTASGIAEQPQVREAITALRVAIAETPRRGTINKALASASADAVRQAVAAVRSCDEGCAALVATLAARTTLVAAAPRRPIRRVGAAAATETEPAATPAGLHALPLPLPERSATGRRHRPEPAAAATTPRALTTPPVAPAPVAPPPTAPSPVTTAASIPFAEPVRPVEPAQPQRAASPTRPPNAPRHPAPSRSTPARSAERPAAATPPAASAATGASMPSRSPGHAWSTGFDGTSRYEQPAATQAAGFDTNGRYEQPAATQPAGVDTNGRHEQPAATQPARLDTKGRYEQGQPAGFDTKGRYEQGQPAGFDNASRYEQPAATPQSAPPAPAAPKPQAPAALSLPLPGRPVSASPVNKPISVPPPPPGITPIPAQRPTVPPAEAGEPFRATLTNAALNSARAERKRPTVIPSRANGRGATTPPPPAPPQPPVAGFQATDLSIPVPAPRPEPGARANWPLVDNTSDERANGEPRFPDLSELPPSELDRPTYSPVGDDRVTPPWLADDMPPEPPILRLVEPPPLADRALREDAPRSRARDERRVRDDYTPRYDAPPLRLVETPASDTGSHPQLPIGISAPPVSDDEGDGDLLIFAAARSAWFTGHPDDESEDLAWASVADTGWQAAEKAAQPAVGIETQSGLPRRVPQANLVPGSPLRDERPLRIVRDAASIAAHTTGYFRGWRRGQEIGGYAVGGRPGREAAGGWDFSRDHGGRDESQEYEYRSARS
ncbi:transposase [Asanoa sp. NPDC049573]|uniref:transposase n=1 Tax=Asanoa sp. NPDC049573 TaxID=3155396 RepID=UPI0034399F25